MRSGITGQNSHVHAHAFVGQTQEPSHRRAGEVRAARSRIDPGTDSSAYYAARRVHKFAVQIGMVIRVFLKHVQMPCWRLVSAFAGRDWTIGHDLVVDHQVSALLWNRDDDVYIVRRRLFKYRLIHLQRRLPADKLRRFAHWFWRGLWSKETELTVDRTGKNSQ